jgi:hypothetical protein
MKKPKKVTMSDRMSNMAVDVKEILIMTVREKANQAVRTAMNELGAKASNSAIEKRANEILKRMGVKA